jgi:hypothetical protein
VISFWIENGTSPDNVVLIIEGNRIFRVLNKTRSYMNLINSSSSVDSEIQSLPYTAIPLNIGTKNNINESVEYPVDMCYNSFTSELSKTEVTKDFDIRKKFQGYLVFEENYFNYTSTESKKLTININSLSVGEDGFLKKVIGNVKGEGSSQLLFTDNIIQNEQTSEYFYIESSYNVTFERKKTIVRVGVDVDEFQYFPVTVMYDDIFNKSHVSNIAVCC